MYTNLPVNAIVRLPHLYSEKKPGSGIIFSTLGWSPKPQLWQRVVKPPPFPINPKIKGIEPSQDRMAHHIYTSLLVNAIIRLVHPGRGDSQHQQSRLPQNVEKQTRSYSSLSTLRPKELICWKMKWWSIYAQIYQKMPWPDCSILVVEKVRVRKSV